MNILKPYAMQTTSRWSAGGVVVREGSDGDIEVVMIGRTAENLWALPKGTPDLGESVEHTAIREVQEETGLIVNLLVPIEDTRYSFVRSIRDRTRSLREDPRKNVRVRKTVHWYLMEAIGGDFSRHDDEYDIVEWVEIEEAVGRFTFKNEAKVAEKAATMFKLIRSTPDKIRLLGEKVTVRSKRKTDAWLDYCWRTDPELSRLDATFPLAMTFAEFQRYHEDDLKRSNSRSMRFAIEDEKGTYIGNCMCYDIDRSKQQAEFGIMIGDRSRWNQGYGTDAAKTTIDHIFRTTRIQRLYLHTLKSNARAQRSFENSGFVKCGQIRRAGLDFYKMEIYADDWMRTDA